MVTCYIALGSNLGDRFRNINLALEYLENEESTIKILKVSSLIETEPVGVPPQPKFLNGVAKLKTSYTARELLERLQEIEVKLGRKKAHCKNFPRTIDLDILIYGDLKIDENDLRIPHPRMWEREFVRVPLKEIAPELFEQGSGFYRRFVSHRARSITAEEAYIDRVFSRCARREPPKRRHPSP